MSLQCYFDYVVSSFQQYVNRCLFATQTLAFFIRNLPLSFFRAFKAKAYVSVKANKATQRLSEPLVLKHFDSNLDNQHTFVFESFLDSRF